MMCGGQSARQGRIPVRLVYGTDGVHRRRSEDANRAGRNLRPRGLDHRLRRPGAMRSKSRMASSTDCPPPLHKGCEQGVLGDSRSRMPASPTSTLRRSAPKFICHLAARRRRGTGIAKAASAQSTSIPSGSQSTWTTPTSCRRRRSTAKTKTCNFWGTDENLRLCPSIFLVPRWISLLFDRVRW